MRVSACTRGHLSQWEDSGVRFTITLVGPEDDYRTYVELILTSLELKGAVVYTAMPVPGARRLQDELSAQLDAAAPGTRHRVTGMVGRVMTSSDLDTPAPGGGPDSAP